MSRNKGWTIAAQLNQESDNILSLSGPALGAGNTHGRKGHCTQGPARAQHGSLWHWAVTAAFWKDTCMEVESDVSYKNNVSQAQGLTYHRPVQRTSNMGGWLPVLAMHTLRTLLPLC